MSMQSLSDMPVLLPVFAYTPFVCPCNGCMHCARTGLARCCPFLDVCLHPHPRTPQTWPPAESANARRQHPVTAASQSPSSTHITLHHNSDNSQPLVHSSTCTIAGRLFSQLTDMLRFYLAFPIDPIEGDPLTDDQVIARHYSRVQQLQRLLFKHHPQLQELALANCGAVASKSRLSAAVRGLQEDVLRTLVTKQLRSGTLHKTVLPVPCVAWMKGWLSSDRQGNCCATAMQVQALCCILHVAVLLHLCLAT